MNISNKLPIQLFTIDSLRADFVDEETFPETFPLLQRDFLTYTKAYSHGVATPFAFPPLINGHLVEGDGKLLDDEKRINEGLTCTAALSNNVHLGESARYDKGWDYWRQDGSRSRLVSLLKNVVTDSDLLRQMYYRTRNIATNHLGVELPPPYVPADGIVNETKNVLSSLDPELMWSHFMDPHYPFLRSAVPDREISAATGYSAGELENLNERYLDGNVSNEELTILRELYRENIRFLDRQLRSLLDWLVSNDNYRKSVIVITADHGEVFGEHGYFNHQWDADPIDELVRVPLYIKPPGTGHGKPIDDLVCHLDIYEGIRGDSEPIWSDRDWAERDQVVSLSNAALRITTPEGSVVRRRNGKMRVDDTISDRTLQRAESINLPNVTDLAGKRPGVETGNKMTAQLEALGYK